MKGYVMRIITGIIATTLLLGACGNQQTPTTSEDVVSASQQAVLDIQAAAIESTASISEACTVAMPRANATCANNYTLSLMIDERDSWKAYAGFLEAYSHDEVTAIESLVEATEGQGSPVISDAPHVAVNRFRRAYGYETRGDISEFMRKQLSDPSRLKLLYSLFGDDVIKRGVGKVGYGEILRWKTDFSPLLSTQYDPRLAMDYSAWHMNTRATSNLDISAQTRYKSRFKEVYGFEPNQETGWFAGWLGRRYAEGGDELVSAWQGILLDASNRIE